MALRIDGRLLGIYWEVRENACRYEELSAHM